MARAAKRLIIGRMTDDAPAATVTPPSTKPSRPRHSLTGGLAFILALTALLGTLYLWYMLTERRGLLEVDLRGEVEALKESVVTLEEQLAQAEQGLAQIRENETALRTTVERIGNDLGRGRKQWLLAEAEQLLNIANHRLVLTRDVGLALAALRAADAELRAVGNPALLPIRRLIAEDIGRLETIERIDFDGVSLRLAGLAQRLERLPLRNELRAAKTDAEATPANASGEKTDLWADLKSLIRIRKEGATRQPLLAPEQGYFVRENLRLTLLLAQLALQQREEPLYRQQIGQARRWLEQYFDAGAPAVAQARQELDGFARLALAVELPELTRPAAALRRFLERERE